MSKKQVVNTPLVEAVNPDLHTDAASQEHTDAPRVKKSLKSDAQIVQHAHHTIRRATPDDKKRLDYQRDQDREIVRGIFRFHEVQGAAMSFVYKAHKGDPVEKYVLQDGGIYNIPLGVARHLNENCWYPLHKYSQDENGKPLATIGRKVRRCSFSPLDFMSDDAFDRGNIDIIDVSLQPGVSANDFINSL